MQEHAYCKVVRELDKSATMKRNESEKCNNIPLALFVTLETILLSSSSSILNLSHSL